MQKEHAILMVEIGAWNFGGHRIILHMFLPVYVFPKIFCGIRYHQRVSKVSYGIYRMERVLQYLDTLKEKYNSNPPPTSSIYISPSLIEYFFIAQLIFIPPKP